MAGEMEEADACRYSNRKNLVMLNHFLRPKVLGVTLIGSTAFEEVDVYMHHPAELFGFEPGWKHKFFFTIGLQYPPRADEAGAQAKGGFWQRIGQRELIKDIDGMPIGSKEQLVFNEEMDIKCSKRTDWCLNEYLMFEEHSLKRNDHIKDDNKKKETWILCELFQKNGAEDREGGKRNSEYPFGLRAPSSKKMLHLAPRPEAFPVVSPTPACDHPSEAMSGSKELNQPSSGSNDDLSDGEPSTRTGDWREKRVDDYTSKDHDDFLAFVEECVNNPPDW